jgi:hypothetical protein
MKKSVIFLMSISFLLTLALLVGKKDRVVEQVPSPPSESESNDSLTEVPPIIEKFTYDDAVNSITKDTLKTDLYHLASDRFEGRMSGKKGNVEAADFIKKKYETFGLETTYHKFSIRRTNPGPNNETGDNFTQNVYAWIEGNDPALKDEIVVVGAHMDHIGYGPSMSRWGGGKIHPGADDNASGTVALMEIAEAFSLLKGEVKRTIVFQSYSAEEMGLIGARYYCDNPLFPKNSPSIKNHIAMINMDMIGYLGQGQYDVFWASAGSSFDVNQYIRELNGKYSFAEKITSRGTGGSDHACFYNKRVPIAFLHTGLHAHYHNLSRRTVRRFQPRYTANPIHYTMRLLHPLARPRTPFCK